MAWNKIAQKCFHFKGNYFFCSAFVPFFEFWVDLYLEVLWTGGSCESSSLWIYLWGFGSVFYWKISVCVGKTNFLPKTDEIVKWESYRYQKRRIIRISVMLDWKSFVIHFSLSWKFFSHLKTQRFSLLKMNLRRELAAMQTRARKSYPHLHRCRPGSTQNFSIYLHKHTHS